MTVATVGTKRPAAARLADMGRQEAEDVTLRIKENFDSLGSMLVQARDRKAYKALGYRTFECYCQSEFGKSVSSAYQLIEDAKVVSQLEARISANYGEEVTLKFPASHLRPLKAIQDIDDKLKAIEYAQKLAASEGKKATKRHLELAVFEVSGKRSEDDKKAVESLGFKKGVTVELKQTLRGGDRGTVTNVDKRGKISVVLFTSGAVPVVCDASELRILEESEKPSNPLTDSTASKGDRVRIFAKGLEGREGEIYTYKVGKQAAILLDGETEPVSVPYAEIELARGKAELSSDWNTELVWESGKSTYYYFPKENKISSNLWPTGLTLEPYTHSGTPIQFIEQWENKFSDQILDSLATPARVKTLALQQAIELPEEDGKEFVADLITSLSQLFPQDSKAPRALGISFSRTIEELKQGKKTQTRRAWQDDYAKNFIRYFDENIAIPALDKNRHRGGNELGFIKLTQRPYQQYLSEMSPIDLEEEGGMVATVQEFIDTFFEGQDKLVWVLHFDFLTAPTNNNTDALIAENQRLQEQLAEAEACLQAIVSAASSTSPLDSPGNTEFSTGNTTETETPGDTAASTDSADSKILIQWGEELAKSVVRIKKMLDAPVDTPVDTVTSPTEETEAATVEIISAKAKRKEIFQAIEKENELLGKTNDETKIKKLRNNIRLLNGQLEDLEKFEQFKIGDTITKTRFPEKKGTLHKLELTPTGMPLAWVKWIDRYGEVCKPESHPLTVLTNLSGREM